MGRTTRGRIRKPTSPRPVERIELNEAHSRLRLFLTCLAAAIAIAAFAFSLNGLLGSGGGWQQIEADGSRGLGCGSELVLKCDLSTNAGGTAAKRKLTGLYTDLCIRCYQEFHAIEAFDGVINLNSINQNPGRLLSVSPLLYKAFERCLSNDCRELYKGPVYADYTALFASENDQAAFPFDPLQNPEQAAWCGEVMGYANDPGQIWLELLGNNQVRLNVSDAYLHYAAENGIERYLDFGAMKNALIIDAVADMLEENGFSTYTISSLDGFSRCNSAFENTDYGNRLFQNNNGHGIPVGEYHAGAPVSFVFLSTYALDLQRNNRRMEDGSLRWPWTDSTTGLCTAVRPELAGCASNMSCGEMLTKMLPVFTSDELTPISNITLITADGSEWVTLP